MILSFPLFSGILIKRYKRFLVDVELDDGRVVTAHTANTGSMLGCSDPGSRVWLSEANNAKRKYALTWELVEIDGAGGATLLGINTLRSNTLVKEGIQNGVITQLQGYHGFESEVKYGNESSRIDLLLSRGGGDFDRRLCYVEVKNVTLAQGATAFFPDAVTLRGTKHLRELVSVVSQGQRAALCFCVQRGDITQVRPADHIDPEYGRQLRLAVKQGVEAFAYKAKVSTNEITLCEQVPVQLW